MSADLLALLDQLDEAHDAWLAGSEGWSDRAIEAMEELPKLTAALRAAQDRADKLNHDADARGHGDVAWGIRYATAEIRDAITAVLTPEPVQP